MASNVYASDSVRDNEQRKFKADSNGDTAVNICGVQLQELIDLLTANNLLWTRTILTIPANTTVVVDNNLLSGFSRLKYFLNFKGVSTSSTKGFDLTVQNNAGTVTETLSTRLGGPLSININVTDDSVDMFLEIVNNESEDLVLSYIKNIL